MNDHAKHDSLQWLCSWIDSQCINYWEHGRVFALGMWDNPGWRMLVDLRGTSLRDAAFASVVDGDSSMERWVSCSVEDNVFHGDSDLQQLPTVLSIFRSWAELQEVLQITPDDQSSAGDLQWLCNWIESQCDGEWEHGPAFEIYLWDTPVGMGDRPAWRMRVNLQGTVLENASFDRIVEGDSSMDRWFDCFVADGVFRGEAGLHQLPRIVSTLRSWAERSTHPSSP